MSLKYVTNESGDRWALKGDPAGVAGVVWARFAGGIEVAFDVLDPSRIVLIRNTRGNPAPWLSAAQTIRALVGVPAVDLLRRDEAAVLPVGEDSVSVRLAGQRLAMLSAIAVESRPTPLWSVDEFLATDALHQLAPGLGFDQHLVFLADIAAPVTALLGARVPPEEPALRAAIGVAAGRLIDWLPGDHPDLPSLVNLEFVQAFGAPIHAVAMSDNDEARMQQLLDVSEIPGLFNADATATIDQADGPLTVRIPMGDVRSPAEVRRLWVRVTDESGRVVGSPDLVEVPDVEVPATAVTGSVELGEQFDPDRHWVELVANQHAVGLPVEHHLLTLAHREARLAVAEHRVAGGLGLVPTANARQERAFSLLQKAGVDTHGDELDDAKPGDPFITELANTSRIRVDYDEIEELIDQR